MSLRLQRLWLYICIVRPVPIRLVFVIFLAHFFEHVFFFSMSRHILNAIIIAFGHYLFIVSFAVWGTSLWPLYVRRKPFFWWLGKPRLYLLSVVFIGRILRRFFVLCIFSVVFCSALFPCRFDAPFFLPGGVAAHIYFYHLYIQAVPHLVDFRCAFSSLHFFSIYFSRRFEKRGFSPIFFDFHRHNLALFYFVFFRAFLCSGLLPLPVGFSIFFRPGGIAAHIEFCHF